MDRYSISIGKTPPPPRKQRKPKEPKPNKLTNPDREAVRESVLSNLMRSAEGRMRLAASMAQPLRYRMDHASIARRAFSVQPLPDRALPIYDVNIEAHYIDEDGQQIRSTTGRRLAIPLFEIASNPQIPLTQIREHRFELIERVQELAVQELSSIEGTSAFSLLERASSRNVLNSELTVDSLIDIFGSMERNDLRVAHLFMNPLGFTTMRRQVGRDCLDIGTHPEFRGVGVMGTIFGAQIIVSRAVPPGIIYATAEPQFVGVIPQRTDVTVLSADNPPNIGFSIFEQIGMACINPRGVIRLSREEPPVEPKIEMQMPEIILPRMDRYALLKKTMINKNFEN